MDVGTGPVPRVENRRGIAEDPFGGLAPPLAACVMMPNRLHGIIALRYKRAVGATRPALTAAEASPALTAAEASPALTAAEASPALKAAEASPALKAAEAGRVAPTSQRLPALAPSRLSSPARRIQFFVFPS